MTYKVSITTATDTLTQDFTDLNDVYNVINALDSFYGDNQLVPISNDPFVAVKFKDITKLVVTGVSRTQLLKYAQSKREQEQAEKMAEYQARCGQQGNAMPLGAIGANLCESSGSRLI